MKQNVKHTYCMIPFVRNLRLGNTNWLDLGADRLGRGTREAPQGTGNVFCLDLGGSYMVIYIYKNSSSCIYKILKICALYYLKAISIKRKKNPQILEKRHEHFGVGITSVWPVTSTFTKRAMGMQAE